MLLVDNAAQPMQAAPVAALKSIAVSGNASKLHVIVTHFDQVKGDNLPGFSDGDELGPAAERVLRRRIDQARLFVGGIQDPPDARKKAGSRSIQHLDAALNLLADPELAADAGPIRPVFNRMNLPPAVMEAAKRFHTRWRGILDLDSNPDTQEGRHRPVAGGGLRLLQRPQPRARLERQDDQGRAAHRRPHRRRCSLADGVPRGTYGGERVCAL